jgi:hypothetical protein
MVWATGIIPLSTRDRISVVHNGRLKIHAKGGEDRHANLIFDHKMGICHKSNSFSSDLGGDLK